MVLIHEIGYTHDISQSSYVYSIMFAFYKNRKCRLRMDDILAGQNPGVTNSVDTSTTKTTTNTFVLQDTTTQLRTTEQLSN